MGVFFPGPDMWLFYSQSRYVECVAFGTSLLFSMVVLQVDLDQHHLFA